MINVKQWKVSLHGVVLHHFDCLSNPGPVIELIDTINMAFSQVSFDGEITANRVSDQFRQRRMKSNVKNWSRIRSEIYAGSISTLVFGSRATNGRDWQAGVAFQMFNEQTRRDKPTSSRHYDEVTFWVDQPLFQNNVVSLTGCVAILQQAWEKLNGLYAFADMFISNQRGAVSPQTGKEASVMFRAKVFGEMVNSLRGDLTTSVPDAYWLNFLNTNHIQRLGGVESIHSQLPKAQLNSIANLGLSIQLAPSPVYESFEEWRAEHLMLEGVLMPILTKRP